MGFNHTNWFVKNACDVVPGRSHATILPLLCGRFDETSHLHASPLDREAFSHLPVWSDMLGRTAGICRAEEECHPGYWLKGVKPSLTPRAMISTRYNSSWAVQSSEHPLPFWFDALIERR